MLISLVSGTYNRLKLLKAMVQSFRDNLLPGIEYEIVLVDGGSNDGTIKWAKAQSDVVLIEDGALLGAISAFTRGAFVAQGKYVLLANDDVAFRKGSVIPAIIHLETNLQCGAVAFADNRPIPDHWTDKQYKTLRMGAIRDGVHTSVTYAQVGLFRKWLGDKLNWWTGEFGEMQHAAVYAGDNSLSAQIWHYGYSVEPVPMCVVEDHVAKDALRQINYKKGLEANDSHWFYDQWPPHGEVVVMSEPQIPQQNRRAARILYMPIYEPGWAIQKHPIHGKRGLRDALGRAKNKFGETHIVQEFDYLEYHVAHPGKLRGRLLELVDEFKPDLILTQLQSWQPITPAMLYEIKQISNATIINWNGDQAPGGLAAPEMLQILHQVDLQLITNMDVVPIYQQEHIKWAYWQIGYEEPAGDLEENVRNYFMEIGRANPFQSGDTYPVVYLASLRTPERAAIANIVREFGGLVCQPSDQYATLYNFSTSTYIYRHAKVIISDNGFTSRGFVSNRLFQALASGGGVVLQQHVDGLDELTGLQTARHYQEWSDISSLRAWIRGFLGEYGAQAQEIAKLGTTFVRQNYSFDAQVTKLMQIIKEQLGSSEQIRTAVSLHYIGRNKGGFGMGNAFPSGMRYEHQPGHNLHVKAEDVEEIMRMFPGQWERLNTE